MDYKKAIAQVVATVASAVVAIFASGKGIDTTEWINIILVGIGAVSVTIVPNLNVGISSYAKSIIAVLTVVLPTLAVSLPGGLDTSEILQLVIAGLGALGVMALKGPQHASNVQHA